MQPLVLSIFVADNVSMSAFCGHTIVSAMLLSFVVCIYCYLQEASF